MEMYNIMMKQKSTCPRLIANRFIGYKVELTGNNGTLLQYQDPDNWDANQASQVGIAE